MEQVIGQIDDQCESNGPSRDGLIAQDTGESLTGLESVKEFSEHEFAVFSEKLRIVCISNDPTMESASDIPDMTYSRHISPARSLPSQGTSSGSPLAQELEQ